MNLIVALLLLLATPGDAVNGHMTPSDKGKGTKGSSIAASPKPELFRRPPSICVCGPEDSCVDGLSCSCHAALMDKQHEFVMDQQACYDGDIACDGLYDGRYWDTMRDDILNKQPKPFDLNGDCWAEITTMLIKEDEMILSSHVRGPSTLSPNQYYMPRDVLEYYLGHSIIMEGLADLMTSGSGQPLFSDVMRMLTADFRPSFIARAAGLWDEPVDDNFHFGKTAAMAQQIHALSGIVNSMVVQAVIPEYVSYVIRPGQSQLYISQFAFDDLGITRAPGQLYFDYPNMVYADVSTNTAHQHPGGGVLDITRPEAKLWVYSRAVRYIAAGCEAVHFGDAAKAGDNDNANAAWAAITLAIRTYASFNARRHFVLLDATTTSGMAAASQLVWDFHSSPLALKETRVSFTSQSQGAELDATRGLYGRSLGGMTFMGWNAIQGLPYMIHLRSRGGIPHDEAIVGTETNAQSAFSDFTWGRDEASWYASQPERFRNYFIEYVAATAACLDSNAFFAFPGMMQGLRISNTDPTPWPTYHCNDQFAANANGAFPDIDSNGDSKPDFSAATTHNGYAQEATLSRQWWQQSGAGYSDLIPFNSRMLHGATPTPGGLKQGHHQDQLTAWSASQNALFYVTSSGYLMYYRLNPLGYWQHKRVDIRPPGSADFYSVHESSDRDAIWTINADKEIELYAWDAGADTFAFQFSHLCSVLDPRTNLLSPNPGKTYFIGTGDVVSERRVWNMWKDWSTGWWHRNHLGGSANVDGAYKLHLGDSGSSNIFYREFGTARVWNHWWDNTRNEWRQAQLNRNCPGAHSELVVRGPHVFYKGGDSRIHSYWYNGNTWKCNALGGVGNVAANDFVVSADATKVIYLGADSRVWMYYYQGIPHHTVGWMQGSLNPDCPANVAGNIYFSKDESMVFYRNTDGFLDHMWWGGLHPWHCDVKWTSCDPALRLHDPFPMIREEFLPQTPQSAYGNTVFGLNANGGFQFMRIEDRY